MNAALAYVERRAREHRDAARFQIAEALRRAGASEAHYEAALDTVRHHACVVIHFHPDRLDVRRRPVAEALLADGVYRNQFETGLSSGGLLPFAGSARDRWEHALFGDAYRGGSASMAERPKYGALELVRFSDGPIPRFGSCYLVLRPLVSQRSTFTFAGSEDPRAVERLGTIDQLDAVMAALFEEIESGAVATPPWPPFRAPTLGVRNLTVRGVLDLATQLAQPRPEASVLARGRVLDTQIEAQVHGPIELAHDVELLVADPAFASSSSGDALRQLAARYGFPLQWHHGFRMRAEDVPDDFRGPQMRPLARHIAGADGTVDAAVIGAAESSLHREPHHWTPWGTHAEVLQLLKQLWHVLVHHG